MARRIRRFAIWGLLGMATLALLAAPVRAGGLRVGFRLHQETGAPLVPVTRNFRLCFGTDPGGTPRLSLCAEDHAPRAPASPRTPSVPAVKAPAPHKTPPPRR